MNQETIDLINATVSDLLAALPSHVDYELLQAQINVLQHNLRHAAKATRNILKSIDHLRAFDSNG